MDEQKQKQEQLSEQQAILARFGLEALKSDKMTDLLQRASELAAEGLKSGFAKILKYLPEEGNFLIVAGVGWSKGVVGTAKIEAGQDSAPGFAFTSDAPVLTDDLDEEKRFKVPALLRENKVRSAVNVIIRAGEERWGVLEADSREPHAFTRGSMDFLHGFSNILGIALSRLEYSEELQRAYAKLESKTGKLEAMVGDLRHKEEHLRQALNREQQARAEAEEGRSILQALMEHIPEGIAIASAPDAVVKMVSTYGRRLIGHREERLEQPCGPEQVKQIYHADGITEAKAEELPLCRVIKKGEYILNEEWILLDRDGRKIEILSSAAPTRDQKGNITGGIVVWRDIRDLKEAERNLRASEERFRAAVDNFPEIFVIYNAERQLQFVNATAQKLLNMPPEAFLGKKDEQIFPPEICSQWLPLVQEAIDSRSTVSGEIKLPSAGGPVIQSSTFVPLLDEQGEIFQVLGIAEDITARRKIEEELQKAQKLESIGLLAGGIAHDFNNILTAILGNIELARMSLPAGEKSSERLSVAEQAAIRARGITRQLLTFAKGGAPIKKVMFVPPLLREPVDLALRGANVKAEYRLPSDLWPVEVDEDQLNQVMNNLAINANQAMPEGGILKIAARNEMVGPENPHGLQEGRYVRIEVVDQGIGIPKKYLDKIFDPYFTTKENGSGLGLSISYSIIKKHGGCLTVDSVPGEGSVFTLLLPAAEKSAVSPPTTIESEKKAGAGRKVLVMDDEEAVNAVAADMLDFLGYRVETVRDGTEAVAAYQKALAAGEPFDAVITDLTVPAGMGGKETVQRLLEIDPLAKVIVSSGYANDPIMSGYADYGFKEVIPKPYKLDELGRVLREVIGKGK